MFKGTPLRAIATWVARKLDALDQVTFRTPDREAIARGWEVRRERRFQRTYRDPRWDLISVCPTCQGSGTVAAQACPQCEGACTVRRDGEAARCSRE
jgi:hypothetical protein